MPGIRRLDVVAIVGFGHLARSYYAPVLKSRLPYASIVVADPLESSRAAAREIFERVEAFTGSAELLAAVRPDAVLVASPPSGHADAFELFAAAGVPIFMEKPFALPRDLPRLDAFLAANSSPAFMINLNRRFWPPYRRVFERVASGELGELRALEVDLRVPPAGWPAVTGHREDPGEGGALHDLGTHAIDLAMQCAGEELTLVSAARGTEDPDAMVMSLTTAAGARVTLRLSYGDPALERVELKGSTTSLAVENPNGRIWRVRQMARPSRLRRSVDFTSLAVRALAGRTLMRFTVAAALTSFIEGVQKGELLQPGLDDALRIARLLAEAETPRGNLNRRAVANI